MAARSLQAGAPTARRFTPLAFLSRGLESLRTRRALRKARRAADAELVRSPVPSLRLSWRAAELVVPKRRLELARSLRGLVRDADARYLPNATPVNRVSVRDASDELLALAERLADLESPVAPRGVLLIEQLLVDSAGPLYDRTRADELLDALEAAAGALELH